MLAAASVIKSAINEGRKHVDQEALKRVYAKLTAAYPVGDVESFGCDVVASRFVDTARQALPHGTRSTL